MVCTTNYLSETLYKAVTADGPNSIRLISLLPGAPTDKLLRCQVIGADLSTSPQFEALSYVWGQPVFDATIICNDDIPFKITSSLYYALMRLRDADKPRLLWVDQICINQASTDDRNAQVARMTRIYSGCQNAIVWLSDVPRMQVKFIDFVQTLSRAQKLQHNDGFIMSCGDISALQLSEMDAAQRTRYGLPQWTDPRWKLLLYMYTSPWMRRTWIVQEVALPPKVDVLIGPVIMDWYSFSALLVYVESLKVTGLDFASLGSWKAFRTLSVRRMLTQQGQFSPLADLLFEHRAGKATDARDRIFGIQGLAAERQEMRAADYAATAASVFTIATIDMFRRSGNLDILGLIGPDSPTRPEKLPSWVPDYNTPLGPHPITKKGMILSSETPQVSASFAASGNRRLSFGIEGQALVLPAVIIGEIYEIANCCVCPRDDDMNLQRGLFLVNLTSAFQSLRSAIESLNTGVSWRKLVRRVTRRSPTYQPTGESTRAAFFKTYYEGQIESITDEVLIVHAANRFVERIWELLTFGQGCAWLPLAVPLVAVYSCLVFIISKTLGDILGFPSASVLEKYAEMTRGSTYRLLCTTKNGLIGLAPPNSSRGDKVALLQGGRVPVVLRREADGFRLVGEAYFHGVMHGEMFDVERVEVIKIR
ncbi:heterokaryon incompatibility protein-domain-containing protein [Xylariaceae sp. FL1272]|nr:heterokaryon incompatibility protein-domain-containing protein [Xylariaceae sp. FL1272]